MQNLLRFIFFLVSAALFWWPIQTQASKIAHNSTLQIKQATEHTLEITVNLVGVDTTSVQLAKNRFTLISIPGFSHLAAPGKPALPVSGQLIVVPLNARITTEFRPGRVYEIENVDIAPAREPATDKPAGEFIRIQQIYTTDAFFPENPVQIEPVKIIRGIPVTILWFAPVQYNPVQRRVRIYRDAEISVHFSGGEGFVVPAQKQSPLFVQMLSNLSCNWPKQMEFAPVETKMLSGCDYLIITHEKFKVPADSLASWRRKMGLHTRIALTQETGATAGAIQQFIQQAYDTWNPPPTDILLLGDVEFVPTHYIKSDVPSLMEPVATDLPYVTVDGEDDFPDICIGRISVDTFTEAMNFVRQVIRYEKNPVADPAFFTRVAVAAQFQDQSDSSLQRGPDGYEDRRFVLTSEEIRNFLISNGYSVARIYEANPAVNPTHYNNSEFANGAPLPPELLRSHGFNWDGNADDILWEIESGCFLLTHRDHGSPAGWSHPLFSRSQVENLTNSNRLPVVLSINCSSGQFDTEFFDASAPESFAEAWLRNPKGGALGVVAPTRTSFSGFNDALSQGLVGAIWPQFLAAANESAPVTRLGAALLFSKLYLATRYPESPFRETTFQEFHWLGDPAAAIRTQVPQIFTVQPVGLGTFGQSRLVVELSEPDATVTVLQKDEILARAVSDSRGVAVLTFPPIDSYQPLELTIQKSEFRPWAHRIGVQNTNGMCLVVEIEKFLEENGDEQVNIGEAIRLPVRLENVGAIRAEKIKIRLSCPDTWVTLVDSLVQRETLAAGETVRETVAFKISPDCPHAHQMPMTLTVTAADYANEFELNFEIVEGLPAVQFSPQILVAKVANAGDSTEIILQLENSGFSTLTVAVEAQNQSWLHFPAQEATLRHHERGEMRLQFFAAKADTQFSTRLRLRTNSPDQPDILIPVHFFVGAFDFQLIAATGRPAESPGNGDHQMNPGEDILLPVTLKNIGTGAAKNVCTTLELHDPHVQVQNAQKTISAIAAGDSVIVEAFRFGISNLCPDGHVLNFEIKFNVNESYTAGTDFSITIKDAAPEIYLEPAALNASMVARNDSLRLPLLVRNLGYGTLRFSFENPLHAAQTVCKPANQVWLPQNSGAGNVFQVTRPVKLGMVQSFFQIDSSAVLCFFICAGDSLTGDYCLLAHNQVEAGAPGTGWYTSGDLKCTLLPGKFYFIGTNWSGAARLGMSSATLPVNFWAGQVMTGTLGQVGCPPQAVVKQRFTKFQPVAQRILEETWLEVPLAPHELPPREATEIVFNLRGTHADTVLLANIRVESNDPANSLVELPVTLTVGEPTRVSGNFSNALPAAVELTNFPNPFNASTQIRYDLDRATHVEISIYNLLGQEVCQLVNRFQQAGFYAETWLARDRAGRPVSSGIYLVVLKAAGARVVRKVVVVQ